MPFTKNDNKKKIVKPPRFFSPFFANIKIFLTCCHVFFIDFVFNSFPLFSLQCWPLSSYKYQRKLQTKAKTNISILCFDAFTEPQKEVNKPKLESFEGGGCTLTFLPNPPFLSLNFSWWINSIIFFFNG